jgi:DMSO reductase family type II enzyme molybdopterin subunit
VSTQRHGAETEERYRARVNQPWDRVTYGTHCVNCVPADCVFYLFARDGKIVREEVAGVVEPVEPGVPDMNPLMCQKGVAWSRELYAADRLEHPLRRVGERGEGRWERISWDEALAETADAILDAIEEIGPESVVMEMSPEIGASVPASRFMSVLGGMSFDVDATINDFLTGLQQTFGKFSFSHSIDDLFHSDCILIWHSNPAHTMIGQFHYMVEARYRGAEIALISTDVSPSHSHVDYHVPVRHGTDAALALAMCQVVIDEGLMDRGFVAAQTDLPLLVRADSGEFLRACHLEPDGADDRFFQAHPERGVVPADAGSLTLDFEPLLEGELEVETLDAGRVRVEPLFARLRRRLDRDYRPEQAAEVCEAHPDTIRMLARKVAARKTRVLLGMGAAKYYHGDLMTRSIVMLLALTGNWGKKGAGIGSWNSFMFDGMSTAMAKSKPGVEGGKEVLGLAHIVMDQLVQQDPTLQGELPARALWKSISAGVTVPPTFFWYHHAGFRERWNRREWNDPDMPRAFDDYYREAVKAETWKQAEGIAATKPPRVLLEVGGNTLRRTRGGKAAVFKSLWPKLRKVVVVDYRMSQTALHADIVLPAAQHYEKTGFGIPGPYTMFLAMNDPPVKPHAEARAEWEILTALCRKLGARAEARGLESFLHRSGVARRYDELWELFTLGGAIVDAETASAEMLGDAVTSGNMPEGTTLDTFREQGYQRYADWSILAMAQANASPFPKAETHSPLRNHLEQGHPYPTLTRRAQFLIDHAWYREADEDLPRHKEPPAMGGDHPFRLSGGHSRWSNHAMNMTNPVLLETHRGKPFVLINDRVAQGKGIEDDSLVRIWNDLGEFVVSATLSPAQRPDGLTVYNGFEGFMFRGGKGSNEVEPGMIKWLHLVGDYGHLTYTPTEWQPVPFDRCIFVDLEPHDAGLEAGMRP